MLIIQPLDWTTSFSMHNCLASGWAKEKRWRCYWISVAASHLHVSHDQSPQQWKNCNCLAVISYFELWQVKEQEFQNKGYSPPLHKIEACGLGFISREQASSWYMDLPCYSRDDSLQSSHSLPTLVFPLQSPCWMPVNPKCLPVSNIILTNICENRMAKLQRNVGNMLV